MNEILIYTTNYCGFCYRAKQLLEAKGLEYKEIKVDGDQAQRQKLAKETGQHTVPQIWIGTTHVGGCMELYGLERRGKLDAMVAG